jgi:hypothetical protein
MQDIERILHYFPETELPVMISEDHLVDFEATTTPFPQAFIDEVILQWEREQDEFTEFMPCFRLPTQEKYAALVYWKASLLSYDFILVTLSKRCELISRKIIASTIVRDNRISKSVASIDPDMIISIMAGQSLADGDYDAASSKAYSMEILPSGEVIFNGEE